MFARSPWLKPLSWRSRSLQQDEVIGIAQDSLAGQVKPVYVIDDGQLALKDAAQCAGKLDFVFDQEDSHQRTGLERR